MNLTAREKNMVEGILNDLLRMPYSELNKRLGSQTIVEMLKLASKMHYYDFCERHGIKYEDMTEDDYEQAYREEWEA